MHFVVDFDDERFLDDKDFQSVQGLKARICKNEGKKGTHAQFDNIILRRAYKPASKIVTWCLDAINNNKTQALDLTVKLLNAELELLSGWKIEHAVPVAWGVDELHAQETKILMETIELSYQRFYVLDRKGIAIAPTIPILKR
jgi:phage tail-like protein